MVQKYCFEYLGQPLTWQGISSRSMPAGQTDRVGETTECGPT